MVTEEEPDTGDIVHKTIFRYRHNLDPANNLSHKAILLMSTSYAYLELYVFVENDILDYFSINVKRFTNNLLHR